MHTKWRELSPPPKKIPANERKEMLARQERSMSSLMKPTKSSLMKKRETGKSTEKFTDYESKGFDTIRNTMVEMKREDQKRSNLEVATIPEFSGSQTARMSISQRETKQPSSTTKNAKSVSKTQTFRQGFTTTTYTTTTKTFVNGKEQASTTAKNVEKFGYRSALHTPKLLKDA